MTHDKLDKSSFTYGHFKSKYDYRFEDVRTKSHMGGFDIIKIFDKKLNKEIQFSETFTVLTPYSVMDKHLFEYLVNERNEKIENILTKV